MSSSTSSVNESFGKPANKTVAEAELLSSRQLHWDESSQLIRAELDGTFPGTISGQGPACALNLLCQTCGAPREGTSRFCASCGVPLETPDTAIVVAGASGSHQTALPNHLLQCRGCGAEVATSLDQRSYTCPFCDTSIVVEVPLADGRQRPEFVIGFSVSAEQAKEKFWNWLKENSWYRPGDLAQQAIAEKQRGIYLPFWHFSMDASSAWTAQIGQYWYRTETYTTTDANGRKQTHTRQIREIEWFPLQGEHQRYYFGFMVPATRGINFEESRAIQPYQLSSLARYQPHYLAGWMAEEYSIDREAAADKAMEEFRRRQGQEIAYFLPGDEQRSLQVRTQMQINGSDLVLLPVHVLSYRYQGQVFRFLVNGQTGKIVGQKPISKRRITALIIVVILIIFSLILTLVLLAR